MPGNNPKENRIWEHLLTGAGSESCPTDILLGTSLTTHRCTECPASPGAAAARRFVVRSRDGARRQQLQEKPSHSRNERRDQAQPRPTTSFASANHGPISLLLAPPHPLCR